MSFLIKKRTTQFVTSNDGGAFCYRGPFGLDEPRYFNDIDELTAAVNEDNKAHGMCAIPTYDEVSGQCYDVEEYFAIYEVNAGEGYFVTIEEPYAIAQNENVAISFTQDNPMYSYIELPDLDCKGGTVPPSVVDHEKVLLLREVTASFRELVEKGWYEICEDKSTHENPEKVFAYWYRPLTKAAAETLRDYLTAAKVTGMADVTDEDIEIAAQVRLDSWYLLSFRRNGSLEGCSSLQNIIADFEEFLRPVSHSVSLADCNPEEVLHWTVEFIDENGDYDSTQLESDTNSLYDNLSGILCGLVNEEYRITGGSSFTLRRVSNSADYKEVAVFFDEAPGYPAHKVRVLVRKCS